MISEYAFINNRKCTLIESLHHAQADEIICIFETATGKRQYVSKSEWDKGARLFAERANNGDDSITSNSPASAKIALFKSLFKGRDDIFAQGFRKRQGEIGYAPACINNRTRKCPRWTKAARGIKCSACPNRELAPVNDQAIIRHFNGKQDDLTDVMGLYVLLENCTTWVLVADFDKKNWQKETALYRDECRKGGLFPAVERSRSGDGAHVWIFFEKPIEAELARNLGCALITHAMSQEDGMSFDAYDRLFPTQSTIPEGGFGNLIALPFQGRAMQNSNTVFVDDEFIAFPDQWQFLSSVRKASLAQVQKIVDSAVDGPLGQFNYTDASSRKTRAKPTGFASRSPSEKTKLSPSDFPKSATIIKGGMLRINKSGLSPNALNRIRRLAAFGNPNFYKAQTMHRSVYNIPRIIWCGEEDNEYLSIPRGCEKKLVELLKEHDVKLNFDDRRVHCGPIAAEFSGVLRGEQQKAADELLHHECGVLYAPTGFGKTVIGAYLIATLRMKTLIVVPKTNLIDQWKSSLERFLIIDDTRAPLLTKSGKASKRKRPVIGQIRGGKNTPSGIIDIATFHSLSAKDEIGIMDAKPVIQDYELVIYDECHYGAAPKLELVMKRARARRVYGLSATPKRSDRLENIIFMHCGPIRYKIDPKKQATEQGFKRILRPRFTHMRLPSIEPRTSYNQVVDLLCAHSARNELIIADAVKAVHANRTPLVISQRKEHAKKLERMLSEAGIETYLLTGEGGARAKRERLAEVHNASKGKFAIVATGGYVGEGFDLPMLDTLLLASPYSWEGVITQYSGRLHREIEGKNEVIVYDYVDTSVPMLERMYKKRLKTYAKLGYEIGEVDNEPGANAQLMDAANWKTAFRRDLANAEKCVSIFAPYASAKAIEQLAAEFSKVHARGIEVRIALREPKDEKAQNRLLGIAKSLKGIGCAITVSDCPLTGIAIFDESVVWYGTLPLLANARKDDCSLRVKNAEIAGDLKEALGEASFSGSE